MKRTSVIDQSCAYLKEAIAKDSWGVRLPGERQLALELGVSRSTIVTALRRLSAEGVLGEGDPRLGHGRIILERGFVSGNARLRIGMLVRDRKDHVPAVTLRERLNAMRRLESRGHTPILVAHPCTHESPKLGLLAKTVAKTNADAWILESADEAILRWFEARSEPVLSNGSRHGHRRLGFTGNNISGALAACASRLIELGHRRIVLLAEEAFLSSDVRTRLRQYVTALESAGTQVGDYHFPKWEQTPAGLNRILESLFQVTPPTALVVWNDRIAAGVYGFLSRRRLTVPKDVSLVVIDSDGSSDWYDPGVTIARLRHDEDRFVRGIIRWVDAVASKQRVDGKAYLVHSEFVDGRSIGQAPPINT